MAHLLYEISGDRCCASIDRIKITKSIERVLSLISDPGVYVCVVCMCEYVLNIISVIFQFHSGPNGCDHHWRQQPISLHVLMNLPPARQHYWIRRHSSVDWGNGMNPRSYLAIQHHPLASNERGNCPQGSAIELRTPQQ